MFPQILFIIYFLTFGTLETDNIYEDAYVFAQTTIVCFKMRCTKALAWTLKGKLFRIKNEDGNFVLASKPRDIKNI